MQIVLYYVEQDDPVSRLVSFISNSDITHASIIHDGVNYDTNIFKDSFSPVGPGMTEADRLVLVYDIPDVDPSQWIKDNQGVKYDLLSYFLWLFKINNRKKMHCFDTVTEVMKSVGYRIPSDLIQRPTGTKVQKWLEKTLHLEPKLVAYKDLL